MTTLNISGLTADGRGMMCGFSDSY